MRKMTSLLLAILWTCSIFSSFAESGVKNVEATEMDESAPDSHDDSKERIYKEAIRMLEMCKVWQAYHAFMAVGLDYQDASKYIASIRKAVNNCHQKLAVGDDGHIVGVKADGTVLAAGKNDHGQCNVDSWENIIAVAAGDYFTIGLRSDGTLVATGSPEYGQTNIRGWNDVVSISADGRNTIGLRSNGTALATGWNEYGQCDVNGWSDITAVSTSGVHTLGLKKDGTVVVTGKNFHGECNVRGWKDIVGISAHVFLSLGVREDGSVVAQGDNDDGQCEVGIWSDIVTVTANTYHTYGIKSDGSIEVIGSYSGPVDSLKESSRKSGNVSGWQDIVAVVEGCGVVFGLRADGTIISTGHMLTSGADDVSNWKLWDSIDIPDINDQSSWNNDLAEQNRAVLEDLTFQLGEIMSQMTSNDAYPVLGIGSKGDDVKRLQQALIDGGFLHDSADGDFGNKTVEAVKKAQEAYDMPQTGVADDAFQERLYGKLN